MQAIEHEHEGRSCRKSAGSSALLRRRQAEASLRPAAPASSSPLTFCQCGLRYRPLGIQATSYRCEACNSTDLGFGMVMHGD